jgi:integrase
MIIQLDSVITQIRRAVCILPQTTLEAHRFVSDLLPESVSNNLQIVGELCSDLAEIRHGAIGLSQALEGVRDLISACCIVLDIEQLTEMWLLDLVGQFSRHLSQSPRYATEFSASPSKQDNVLIYFLAHTRKELLGEMRLDDDSERWRLLCYLGYCGTRIGLDSSLATQQLADSDESSTAYGQVDHQAMESARAVELFIKYVPLAKFNGQIPTLAAPELIEYTITRIAKPAEGIARLETARRYLKWARALLSRSLLYRERRPTSLVENHRRRRKDEALSFDRDHVTTNTVDSDRRLDTSFTQEEPEGHDSDWAEAKAIEIEEGGSLHEYSPSLPPSTILSLRAGLSERARLFIPLSRIPIWHSSVLTQEVLGAILAYIVNRTAIEDMDVYQLGILCFVTTQIHFGFSADRLSQAEIGDSSFLALDRKPVPLMYKPEQGSFEIYPQGHDGNPVFGHVHLHRDGPYLPSAHSFSITVPSLIRSLLAHFLSLAPRVDNRLFTFSGKDGQPVSINRAVINEHLQPLKRRTGEKIDANRIGRSALIHLMAYSKNVPGKPLDELVAAFISGFIPRQWAAQAHYVNLSISEIQADYFQAIQASFARLCAVSRLQIESLGLGGQNCLDQFLLSDPLATDPTAQSSETRFGSPFVLRQEYARHYLHTLRGSLEDRTDPYLRFNRLTAYIALAMMWLTGMRPVELAFLTEEHIWPSRDDSEAMLCLRSKPNKHYEEWRTLLLSSPFGSLLKTYRKEVVSLFELLWKEGCNLFDLKQCRGNSLFFFIIGHRRKLVPLSTTWLRTVLRESSETHLGLPPFLGRMNSPRHFFSSTAVSLGLPRRIVDVLMGHQTRGREVLGRYSLMHFSEVLQAARHISGVIARQLDIEPLTEKPS